MPAAAPKLKNQIIYNSPSPIPSLEKDAPKMGRSQPICDLSFFFSLF
jgi:hypothetical protein